MGTVSAEELGQLEAPAAESLAGEDGGAAGKERIRVSIRLRPLNEEELAKNDPSDWECLNQTTLAFRSTPPAAYSFDRVFCCESNTRQVYEGGAREVAMSVVGGINASIFAYGQTSSGKTYTMTGITEMAAADIYDHIERHAEREFVLKFSAMEIYNESVRDLLSTDGAPLRLLDGPGRSTIVEKLTEEVVKDWAHIMQLLSICEAQREIGETLLNKTSSRSHQIIRLTIESSAREFVSVESSRGLTASVHFVDLAGSERASQAMSAGARLKEGCHINRSLLTLGTVIRKLSKDHIGHIPYRDSKLTRILQQSLGGNARTAIICTMSPARSHIEQSRNTLLFATCAKEVVTRAEVNVVMSDKALVKHLQRELARLESQLRVPRPISANNYADELLREREDRIQQMEIDIREITRQRDAARAQLDDMLRTVGDDRESIHQFGVFRASVSDLPSVDGDDYSVDNSIDVLQSFENSASYNGGNCRQSPEISTGDYSVDNSIDVLQSFENSSSYNGGNCRQSPEISTGDDSVDNSIDVLQSFENSSSYNVKNFRQSPEMEISTAQDSAGSVSSERREFLSLDGRPEIEELCKEVQCVAVDKTITCLQQPEVRKGRREWELMERGGGSSSSTSWRLGRSRSCRATLMGSSPSLGFQEEEESESTPPGSGFLVESESRRSNRPEDIRRRLFSLGYGADGVSPSPSNPPEAEEKRSSSMKDVGVDPITMSPAESPARWPEEFERRRLEIIELWHLCNVSIVHRTFFFLLCLGDPGDSIYLELELRRLSFIKRALAGGNGGKISPSSNAKALRRERGMLCRQMQRRLSAEEREALYRHWGIPLQTKQRKLQLAHLVWTAAGSVSHAAESAAVVAKVVGQPTEAHKEMLILSFSLTHSKKMKVNL